MGAIRPRLSAMARTRTVPALVLSLAGLLAYRNFAGRGFVAYSSQRRNAREARRVTLKATQDELKKQVGYKAVDDYVKSGTVIGLGTGSTAAFAVDRVGEKLKSGELKDIIAIPTSIR